MLISIIFPVYNEEKRLKKGLEEALQYFTQQKKPFEVIVVNDGSVDGTAKILKSWPNLRVVSYQENSGKGAAIKKGISKAKGSLILISDIDLSVPISTIDEFVREINGFDIVIGSRRVKGSKVLFHQSLPRETMGYLFTKLSNLVLGTNCSDFTCGFKLFTQKAAKEIFTKQKIKDWAFDSEVLFLAKKMNFKVKEVGAEWSDVKGSKVKFPKDIITSFLSLIKIRFFDFRGKYEK